MDKILIHRQIYPLPFEQISKMSSFEQILGRKITDYTEEERKTRWEKAMSFPGSKKIKEIYSNDYECCDCQSFSNGWCKLASLPCGVNPITTFQNGMSGFACRGTGFQLIEGSQLEMEFEPVDFPF